MVSPAEVTPEKTGAAAPVAGAACAVDAINAPADKATAAAMPAARERWRRVICIVVS
jgi:hypothetical protein